MKKFSVSQLIGPIALFMAVAGAEAASYALSRMPSSDWIWYLNLTWFGMFQQSHYSLQGKLGIDCEQLIFIALPLLVTAVLGYRLRKSLLLAISSNLSFVYIGFVFCTWARAKSFPQTASLSGEFAATPDIWSNADFLVLVTLVSLSLFSCLVSHFSYIRKVCAAFS
jgi:hypothetical protein